MKENEIRLLSRSETAKLMGIGKEKLNKLITSGKIGFLKIDNRVYVPYKEIVRFLNENTSFYQTEQVIAKNDFDSVSLLEQILHSN